MYLGSKSISCLRVFIDGWYYRNTEETDGMEVLNEFSKWLQDMYGFDNQRPWDKIILFNSSDQAVALDNFFELFDEFLDKH